MDREQVRTADEVVQADALVARPVECAHGPVRELAFGLCFQTLHNMRVRQARN